MTTNENDYAPPATFQGDEGPFCAKCGYNLGDTYIDALGKRYHFDCYQERFGPIIRVEKVTEPTPRSFSRVEVRELPPWNFARLVETTKAETKANLAAALADICQVRPRCETCRHFKLTRAHVEPGLLSAVSRTTKTGECRNDPPKGDRTWPAVDGADWCGMHAGRSP
jgi:hypothetical protein